MSGVYDYTAFDPAPNVRAYIGDGPDAAKNASAAAGLVGSGLPVLFCVSEFDSQSFHKQAQTLIDGFYARDGHCANFQYLPRHNHLSQISHLNAAASKTRFGATGWPSSSASTPRPQFPRSSMSRLGALCLAAAVLLLGADQPAPDRIRLALSPTTYSNLPIFLAIDNGYFAQQHLDVVVVPYSGSSVTQLPYLARGEIDISNVAPAPGLFNLVTEGFNVKIVASLSEAHRGWNGTTWLMVRQDLWDAKTIRKPSDLRGMHVDVAAEGAPTDLLVHEVIRQAGLAPSDVNVTAACTPRRTGTRRYAITRSTCKRRSNPPRPNSNTKAWATSGFRTSTPHRGSRTSTSPHRRPSIAIITMRSGVS